jgi:hypothetical protein
MSTEIPIELPYSGYDIFMDLIRGFVSLKGNEQPVSSKAIAEVTGRHFAVVSNNIKSIVFLGIANQVENGLYKLTNLGYDLAYSLEWRDEAGIAAALRSIIINNDFLKNILLSIKSRNGLSESDLKLEIAKRAKLNRKDRKASTGAQTIVNIIYTSQYVFVDNNIIKTSQIFNDEIKKNLFSNSVNEVDVFNKVFISPDPFKKDPNIAQIGIKIDTNKKDIVDKKIPINLEFIINVDLPLNISEVDLNNLINNITKIKKTLNE